MTPRKFGSAATLIESSFGLSEKLKQELTILTLLGDAEYITRYREAASCFYNGSVNLGEELRSTC
jgi:hypothetical protein